MRSHRVACLPRPFPTLDVALSLLLLTGACAQTHAPAQAPHTPAQEQAPSQAHAPAPTAVSDERWNCFFGELGVKGVFVLSSSKNAHIRSNDPARATRAYLPASTFKVANSLIGLETGVVSDDSQVFVWDGKEREFSAWNQNHTLQSAFENSVVPVYQVIARQIGQQRMQHWVNELDYGNKDISGAQDGFWLDGGLRISAAEQIELLTRLDRRQLPLSKRSQDIVVEIMKMAQTEDYTLRGKTGWVSATQPQLGWWIGWLEMKGETLYFALNMDVMKPEDLPLRKQIGLSILQLETKLPLQTAFKSTCYQ
jgi:beta-lactamase class D